MMRGDYPRARARATRRPVIELRVASAAMTFVHVLGYVALGLTVGTLGTLIGAGGGFALIPVLLFLFPHEPAANLTAISLAVVCANAVSGTLAYSRLRRVDWRSALLFAVAGLPGSILGAWITRFIDRRLFDPLLGGTLVLGGLIVLVQRREPVVRASGDGTRTLIERDGNVHRYSPRIGLGMLVSVGVGVLSSLLGIGGGIIHVPAMVYVLGFPTHVATATSHAVVAILTLAAVAVHAADGTLARVLGRTLPIGAGALVGAQLGARLSTRVQGRWILRALGAGLFAVGVRLLFPRAM
jgi:uncharacterized membrane protein YfcA